MTETFPIVPGQVRVLWVVVPLLLAVLAAAGALAYTLAAAQGARAVDLRTERALRYVTDPSRVAYVPTRAGYSVLLSVADPAAFLASLRRVTAR